MITQLIDLRHNSLIVGPTRTGKTSAILKPLVYELLLLKKKGIPLGMTIIETKKEVGETLKEMCKEMDIPFSTTGRVQRDGILVVEPFDNGKHYREMIEFGKLKIQQVVGDLFNDTDKKRQIPHFLIVDEMDQFVYPEFEEFLALSPTYNVTGIFTVQTLHQLGLGVEQVSNKERNTMLSTFLTNCRNKVVFRNVSYEEAVVFSNMFGNEVVGMEQEKVCFNPLQLMELPFLQCVAETVQNGKTQKPFLYQAEFLPSDWKEKREWENVNLTEVCEGEAADLLEAVNPIRSSPISSIKGGPIGRGYSIGTTLKSQTEQDVFSMDSLIEQKTDEAKCLIGYVAFLNYLSQYCQTLEPFFREHQIDLIGRAQKKLEQRGKLNVYNFIEELKNEINLAERPDFYSELLKVIKNYQPYGDVIGSINSTLASLLIK